MAYKMQIIDVFSVDPSYTYITFSNATPASIQQLRKTVFDELYSFAFDAIIVRKNTSFTEDQILMDYLNFVLIKPPLKFKDQIKTSFGNFYDSFELKAKGPMIVNSNDIKTKDGRGFSILKDQPLFWLRENEEIDIIIFVAKGRGKDHVKFRQVTEMGRIIPGDPYYVHYLTTDLRLDPQSPEYEAAIERVTETTIRVESIGLRPSLDIIKEALNV